MKPTEIVNGCELYLADCLDVLPELAAGSIDAVVTDPPYGIGISGNPFRQKFIKQDWDDSPMSDRAIKEIFRLSNHQIIWGGNYFALPPSQCFLIWNKKQSFDFSSAMVEMAWTSFQRPAKMFEWFAANGEKEHPTQKPLALMEWCLSNFTKFGDLVLDPFMGSGTTGVACIQTGRRFIGMEKDPAYFKIAVKRIAQAQPPLFVDAPTLPAPDKQGELIPMADSNSPAP